MAGDFCPVLFFRHVHVWYAHAKALVCLHGQLSFPLALGFPLTQHPVAAPRNVQLEHRLAHNYHISPATAAGKEREREESDAVPVPILSATKQTNLWLHTPTSKPFQRPNDPHAVAFTAVSLLLIDALLDSWPRISPVNISRHPSGLRVH